MRPCTSGPLPLHLDAERALMRLVDGAELAVIIDVKTHGIVQAERSRRAGIGAIPALAEALHGDALRTKADDRRRKILSEVVDEFAVGRQVENFLIDNPVMPDLRADQDPGTLLGCAGRGHRVQTARFL